MSQWSSFIHVIILSTDFSHDSDYDLEESELEFDDNDSDDAMWIVVFFAYHISLPYLFLNKFILLKR